MDPAPAPVPAPAPTPAPLPPYWPRPAQLALVCLILLALGLLARSAFSNAAWRARPTELADGDLSRHRIDLNHASKAELLQVPGVGEKTVERILDYRARQRFHSVDDLLQVGGIRQATLDKLRRYFCVESDEDDTDDTLSSSETSNVSTNVKPPPPSSPPKKTSGTTRSTTKKSSLTQIVNINTADTKELQTLEGIGPERASEILRERSKSPFKTVDDLTRVKGIKQATLDKIRPRLTVD